MLFIICLVGFVAGFIDAIVGGGGMLTIPTLLTLGLPAHIVLGTNKLAASFGSLTASYAFYRKKLFNPFYWRFSLIATAIGAIFGTLLVSHISTEFLNKILPVVVIFTAIYTLFSKQVINQQTELPKGSTVAKQVTQGLMLGFYDGVAGPGTGAFWMTSSSMLYKINILLCSGLARSNNFISNICSLITFLVLGYVNFAIGLLMGVFIMLGSWVGAHSAIRFGSRFIRPLFIVVVIMMAINLVFKG